MGSMEGQVSVAAVYLGAKEIAYARTLEDLEAVAGIVKSFIDRIDQTHKEATRECLLILYKQKKADLQKSLSGEPSQAK